MKSYIIEHVGLEADDTEALAAWYAATLGFEEFFRTDSAPPTIFMKDPSNAWVEIFARKPGAPKPRPEDRSGMHIAIVVDDFDAAERDLADRGASFITDSFQIFAGGKARFFADPEGNRLHIVYRPSAPWEEMRR